jgi:hypothetical protein
MSWQQVVLDCTTALCITAAACSFLRMIGDALRATASRR